MVNSTPIVIRSLVGRFPHNFRDLTMVAGTIGDYAAFVVGKDSDRDFFMSAEEAKDYGIIDHVITTRDDLDKIEVAEA